MTNNITLALSLGAIGILLMFISSCYRFGYDTVVSIIVGVFAMIFSMEVLVALIFVCGLFAFGIAILLIGNELRW